MSEAKRVNVDIKILDAWRTSKGATMARIACKEDKYNDEVVFVNLYNDSDAQKFIDSVKHDKFIEVALNEMPIWEGDGDGVKYRISLKASIEEVFKSADEDRKVWRESFKEKLKAKMTARESVNMSKETESV